MATYLLHCCIMLGEGEGEGGEGNDSRLTRKGGEKMREYHYDQLSLESGDQYTFSSAGLVHQRDDALPLLT